jgi:outer membrane protein TolC
MALDAARAGYWAGKTDFLNLADAWRTVLGLELGEVEAQSRGEQALTELSLLVAGLMPAQAPVLSGAGPGTAGGSAAIPRKSGEK